MKKYINLTVLLPLSIFTMDMQGPITHLTERKYPFSYIRALTIEKLDSQKECFLKDSNFHAELPLIISEASSESLNDRIDVVDREKCCIYTECVATAGIFGCLSGCFAYSINADLGRWLCTVGTGVACLRCNNALKHTGRKELKRKIELLKLLQLESMTTTAPVLIRPEQDQYNFSYDEGNDENN